MIISMTGFGSAKVLTDKLTLNVQVKSVNGRFLETRFRMPREYAALETELRKLLSKLIQRGNVDISIHKTTHSESVPLKITPNIALAFSWLKAYKTLGEKLGIDAENPSLETLMRFPELLQIDPLEVFEDEQKNLMSAFVQALDECMNEKVREGQALNLVLSSLLSDLEKQIKEIEQKKSQIHSQLQTRLEERLKTLNAQITLDPSRLAQEALLLLEKSDITEEIDRAKAHVQAFRESLKVGGVHGKKLEFYTQELHRELNTMGAKTQNLSVTANVMDSKAITERLREQVQNVE